MYGTVARFRLKPGMEDQLQREQGSARDIPGLVFEPIYRMDADSNEYLMVVGFTDKAAYVANANSPEQHERYLSFGELLGADPEWHDGEISSSYPPQA